eukprot:TRINITY_DN17395_c0_g1_i1.p1 TRINITY_DN17395_c0_g1~~TRINITY_DN17395_c0_g1_i1.p1  ORF type:complete len:312 (+),score=49.21 TRINITY_DN17395_c0_g1_i1:59-994(+)
MEEKTIQTNDCELQATTRKGSGQGNFVWAHCMGGCRASEEKEGYFNWDDAGYAALVKYDSRGHGSSEGSEGGIGYTFKALGGDMVRVAREIFAEEPTILGGASMGCAATLHAAVEDPKRVRGLVLCIPPPCYDKRDEKRAFMESLSSSFTKEGGYEKYLAVNRASRPVGLFAEAGKKHTWEPPAFISAEHAAHAMLGASLSDFPSQVLLQSLSSIPALILSWEGDSMHPIESAKTLHTLLPGSKLVVASTFTEVQSWPSLVRSFIDSLDHSPPAEVAEVEERELQRSLLKKSDEAKNVDGDGVGRCCCLIA